MASVALKKIISGGQTGVDQGGLDAALQLGLEHGGWCPAGRRSERGRIPVKYQLSETSERNYVVRTERNVVDSDGTLILYRNQISGGTELTHRLAIKHGRPHLCLDLDQSSATQDDFDEVKQQLFDWLSQNSIESLNVAGPRESTSAGIQAQSKLFLIAVLMATRPIH